MNNRIIELKENDLVEFLNELESLKEEFLRSVDVSERTVEAYKYGIENFIRWLRSYPGRQLDKPAALEYKAYLEDVYKIHTANQYLVSIRRLFEWAVNGGRLPYNPFKNIKGFKKPRRHLRDDLTLEEIKAVFGAVDTTTELGLRDKCVMTLMAKNGLRISEVRAANIGDIEVRKGRKVLWVLGKNRSEKDDFVVLSPDTERILDQYLSIYRQGVADSEPLFIGAGKNNQDDRMTSEGIRKRIYEYYSKAGINRDRITVHSLRHSFVTLMIEAGIPIQRVQQAARHRSVETTLRYFHEHSRLEEPAEDAMDEIFNSFGI